jgi:hypothetical protein
VRGESPYEERGDEIGQLRVSRVTRERTSTGDVAERRHVLCAAIAVAVLAIPSASSRVQGAERVRGDGGAPFALVTEVSCDPLPGPGKVQCLVRVKPIGGALRWSDAIVVAAPSFAPPLRTRVAAGDAKHSDLGGVEFSLALAATGDGVGELKVLARGAVCGDGGCRPVQAEGAARVVVGATIRAAPEPYRK